MISRVPRRTVGALAVVLAVVSALFSVGAANACACGGPPTVPQSVVATQASAGEVTVNWQPPADQGDSAVSSYSVGWSLPQSGTGEQVGADVRTETFSQLSPGSYTFFVYATNDQGDSSRVEVPLTVYGDVPTLSPSHTTVTAKGTVTLSGIWRAGRSLHIERAVPGGSYTSVATVTVDDANSFSRTLTAAHTATYRVETSRGLLSAGHRVDVKAKVTLGGTRRAVRTYRLAGHVYPAVTGQLVHIYIARNGGYTLRKTLYTTRTGYFGYTHRLAATDTYRFKANSRPTTLNTRGSQVVEVAVH